MNRLRWSDGEIVIEFQEGDDKTIKVESKEEFLKRFPKPEWADRQLIRFDRNCMVEDLCKEHGCGHPNKTWLESEFNNYKDPGIHGCCSCHYSSKEKEDAT